LHIKLDGTLVGRGEDVGLADGAFDAVGTLVAVGTFDDVGTEVGFFVGGVGFVVGCFVGVVGCVVG